MGLDTHERVRAHWAEAARTLERFAEDAAAETARVAEAVAGRLRGGGKLLAFGNGGSAADAQHLAAEFVNRFLRDRPPLAAVALTTDTSALTAIGNDFGFDEVFEKQVRALARPGDVAVGISTSGRSPNVLRGLRAAREAGCLCVGLTGEAGAAMAETCDHLIRAPSRHTPRIQECHVAWIHALCDLVDEILFPAEPA
ncbi:MAG: SIS domain-containing protein [Candidatus Dadabacteria bacterium]|nr:MAG: SIS domain-containing protein [Candidatus Dadabacteria bacterium]